MPILNGITIRLSLMDRRGAANATIFDSIDIGMGVGSIIWGFVSQYEGFSAIYFGEDAVSVIYTLLYLFILNRKLNLFSMLLVSYPRALVRAAHVLLAGLYKFCLKQAVGKSIEW